MISLSSLALELPMLSLPSSLVDIDLSVKPYIGLVADIDLFVKPCIGLVDALYVEFSRRY